MIKLDNSKIPPKVTCLLDTDIIVNWLSQEEDPVSKDKLWVAPHKIIRLIEEKKINGFSTLVNLLEIRFVLRRKKDFSEAKINDDIARLLEPLEIIVPDEVNLLEANGLQAKHPLSPFDAIILAIGSAMGDVVFISRDKALLKLSSKFLTALTPEDFLNEYKLG